MAANEFDDDQTRPFTNLAAGTKVSHYAIISKIGAGGMGEVYLAEDTQLDRKVALKFLPPHLSQDEASRTRFTREAKAAAKLDHPNIVQVFVITSLMPVWWLGCYAVISRPIGVMKKPYNHCYVQLPFTS